VAIEALLAGKKIVYDRTRPFGCSTKWGFKRRSVDYATAMWNEKPVGMQDIDLDAVKKLAANDSSVLRLICVWSLSDAAGKKVFDDLIMLRRIYQHRPLELITVNADPADKKKDALAFLAKHHAARPDPSRGAPVDPKAPINYMFTGKDTAALLKALGAKADGKTKPKAPYSAMIIPSGEVIHTQSGRLDPQGLRVQLVKVFQR
jgi:hypothetical protein